MCDGAVGKKWRRVISVGGRTPAPPRRRRAARAEFCNFWVSFYRSQCHHRARPRLGTGGCACCGDGEEDRVLRGLGDTAQARPGGPPQRYHTAQVRWLCVTISRSSRGAKRGPAARPCVACEAAGALNQGQIETTVPPGRNTSSVRAAPRRRAPWRSQCSRRGGPRRGSPRGAHSEARGGVIMRGNGCV